MLANTSALETYLAPLEYVLKDSMVSEILINQAEKIYVEKQGNFEELECSDLTYRHLQGLTTLIASYSEQRLSEKEPLLSAQLPSGHRIQIILPPATAHDRLIISIRKQTIVNTSLDDLAKMGSFSRTKPFLISNESEGHDTKNDLSDLFSQPNYLLFLKEAIKQKKNIVIAGATSTGKTTFLNACLKEIPEHEHLVTLEDVAEVKPPQRLHTPLFTSKGLQGVAQITMQNLIEASLRIRPDRIIMGELRGAEAADFINATATGHDGSITSIHAATPAMAFMRLVHMVKLSGTTLSKEDILSDLKSVIDIVVQLKRRFDGQRYFREVSHIYYDNKDIL